MKYGGCGVDFKALGALTQDAESGTRDTRTYRFKLKGHKALDSIRSGLEIFKFW